MKRQVYVDITRTKINMESHHLQKSYNKIVDKIEFISLKAGQK